MKSKSPPTGLEAICKFGKTPENEDNTLRILLEVLKMLNRERLTKLNYNVILITLGALAQDQTNTPEKELEVCFGKS